MVQKILQVGNSAAVTLNKKHLSYLGLSIGDYIQVLYDIKLKTITITPVSKTPQKSTLDNKKSIR